jgi:transposase
VNEWSPERHLARLVVEVIEGLDLRAISGSYRGSGEASYHPQLLLGLIIDGYATDVFSSRKLTRWRSASSPQASIPITARSPRSGGAF